MYQQSGGNTGALRSGEYRHSANVAFVLVDDTISDRADNLRGVVRCYEYGHLLKTSLNCFRGEYGVGKRIGRVGVAIHVERCRQARENAACICARRLPNEQQRASRESLL